MQSMKKRGLPAIVLGAACACLLAGCALMEEKASYQPTDNMVMVSSDGSLEWASVEKYGEGNYSQEEMADFARERIGAFNESVGAGNQAENTQDTVLPVSFVSGEMADGRAVLITAYDSPERLLEFAQYIGDYNVPFTQLEICPASELGEELDTAALMDRNGKTAENSQDVSGKEGALAIKAEGQGLIRTEERVSLVSEGCQLRDEHTVLTAKEGVSYIVTE